MKKIILIFLVAVFAVAGVMPATALTASAAASPAPSPDGNYYYVTFELTNDYRKEKFQLLGGDRRRLSMSENGGLNKKDFRQFNLEVKFPSPDKVLVYSVMVSIRKGVPSSIEFETSTQKVLIDRAMYEYLANTKYSCYLTLMHLRSGGAALYNSNYFWLWGNVKSDKNLLFDVPYTVSASPVLDANAVVMDGYYNSVDDENQKVEDRPDNQIPLLELVWNATVAVFDGSADLLDWIIFVAAVFVLFVAGSVVGKILRFVRG